MFIEPNGTPTEEAKVELDNFEYVEFYKSQLTEIKAENELLKQEHSDAIEEKKLIQTNCFLLVEKICKENNYLKDKAASVNIMHTKGIHRNPKTLY